MRTRRNAADGFTLIELLVAMSILSIIMLPVYASFAGGITTWRRAQEFTAVHQTARVLLEDIAQELQNAVALSGVEFVGESRRLSFVTLRPRSSPTGGPALRRLTSVTYEVRRDRAATGYSLLRVEAPYAKDAGGAGGEPTLLMGSLSRVAFQYSHKTREGDLVPWGGAWEVRGAIPLGVRVTLVVGEARFTKTVFIPHGYEERDDRRPG
jgi:general secretion pathway protein J